MTIIRHTRWVKITAMAVVCLFLVNTLAWAYPPDQSGKTTLGIPLVNQVHPLGNNAISEHQQKTLVLASTSGATLSVAKYLLEDQLPIDQLETVIRDELSEQHLRRVQLDLVEVTILRKDKSKAFVSIPFTMMEGNIDFFIIVAKKGVFFSREIPGEEWNISKKYDVWIVPGEETRENLKILSDTAQVQAEKKDVVILTEDNSLSKSLSSRNPKSQKFYQNKILHTILSFITGIFLFYVFGEGASLETITMIASKYPELFVASISTVLLLIVLVGTIAHSIHRHPEYEEKETIKNAPVEKVTKIQLIQKSISEKDESHFDVKSFNWRNGIIWLAIISIIQVATDIIIRNFWPYPIPFAESFSEIMALSPAKVSLTGFLTFLPAIHVGGYFYTMNIFIVSMLIVALFYKHFSAFFKIGLFLILAATWGNILSALTGDMGSLDYIYFDNEIIKDFYPLNLIFRSNISHFCDLLGCLGLIILVYSFLVSIFTGLIKNIFLFDEKDSKIDPVRETDAMFIEKERPSIKAMANFQDPPVSTSTQSEETALISSFLETIGTTTINNNRSKSVYAANEIIDFLNTQGQEFPQAGITYSNPIRRKDPTLKIGLQLKQVLSKLDKWQAFLKKGDKVNDILDKIKLAKAVINNTVHLLETDSVISSIIILARKAKRQNQKLIIGLETSWIPGYKRGDPQHNALNPFVQEITKLDKTFRKLGLDIIIVYKEKGNLEQELLTTAENNSTDLANIIVLASNDLITSLTESNSRLVSTSDREGAFLAGIKPEELLKFYDKNKNNPKKQLQIELMRMISLTLELALGKDAPILAKDSTITIFKYDPERRIVIYLPFPKEIDIDKQAECYRVEARALNKSL